jgi:capsular exopolysaccharide synthesis family protein
MSNVYKALKRAEREGRWRPETPNESEGAAQSTALAQEASADPNANIQCEDSTTIPISPTLADRSPGTSGPRSDEIKQKSQAFAERGQFLDDLRTARPRFERERAASVPPGPLRALWRLLIGQETIDGSDAPSIVIGDEATTGAAEKFQLLRVWLQNWTKEHHERVILVTSALPGEGKSFVSLNLALALASSGHSVMLIDADLRKPCLHRSFSLTPLNGLHSYLDGRSDFAQSLSQVGLPNLTLVSAQEQAVSATELIAGPRMKEFLQQAREMDPEQFILIDAPPALATPESEILTELVDAVLFVMAANHTPREMVIEALKLLANVPKLGVVLNRFEPAFSTSQRLGYSGYYSVPKMMD